MMTNPTHFHAGHWTSVPEGDPLLDSMRRVHTVTRQTLETAQAVARMRRANEAATAVQNMRGIQRHVDAKVPPVLAEIDRLRKRTSEAVRDIESAMQAPLAAAASWKFAAETRAHVKGLPDRDARSKFVRDALWREDYLTAGAVLSAPEYLSGLTDTDVAMLQAEYRHARFKEQLDYIATVQGKQELLDKAGGALLDETGKLVDRKVLDKAAAHEAKIAELER